MRTTELVLMLSLAAMAVAAQQPASAPTAVSSAAGQNAATTLHQSALKFCEAFDVRKRLEQNLDKLIDDGKQSLLKRNPLINPQFVDEWAKRMRLQVNLDEMVDATARVYEKYYTSEELDQLAQVQLAMKRSKLYSIPPELAQKVKSDSPKIQSDINAATSALGSRWSIAVGQQIEKEHPDWVKPVKPDAASAPKS
jgi:hypothetical protein